MEDRASPPREDLMDRVKGKIALITGAGTGVGRACMKLFAREGAKVVGVSRTQSNLDETLSAVKEAGGEGIVVAADLANSAGAEKAVAASMATYGQIDILVNSAGVGYSWLERSPGSMGPVDDTTPEKWAEVMAINLDSLFHMCRLVIPLMKKQGGGSIVNVTSISGLQGLPVAHTYTAAKGAAINLTRSLAITYCGDNIRANCIAPGFIATPMVQSVLGLFDDPAMADRLCPMKRPGTAEEMAYACLYLGSDEASYCQGTVLVVDGGTTARQ
jgi:NAD(P)-dependent dehydrogenase (short-subunit alcohol dehydrogenase family)